MLQSIYVVKQHDWLTSNVKKLVLSGDTSALIKPGQFVNVKIDGLFLRRPISVFDWDEDSFTIIYKLVGEGTSILSEKKIGDKLDILTGLGNGFATDKSGEKPLLIGGGVGVPPMFGLCKKLISENKKPKVILGFNTKSEVFGEDEFKKLGVDVIVTTVDGSYGQKGFVTDQMNKFDYSYFFTCGPMPMFLAIEKVAKTSGQYSFEERMGCGFGACVGCTCKTKYGNKRICKDGPVLEREEIIW